MMVSRSFTPRRECSLSSIISSLTWDHNCIISILFNKLKSILSSIVNNIYLFSFSFLSTKRIVAIVSLAFKFGWSWYNCFCLSLPLRSMFYANRFCLWYIAAERNLLFRCFFVECGVIKKIPMKQVSLSLFLSFFPTHTHALILLSLHALTTSLHHTHTWYTGHTLSLSCPLTFTHSSYPAPLQTHTILILPTHTHGTHSLTRTPSQRNAQTFFPTFPVETSFQKLSWGWNHLNWIRCFQFCCCCC